MGGRDWVMEGGCIQFVPDINFKPTAIREFFICWQGGGEGAGELFYRTLTISAGFVIDAFRGR